MSERRLTSAGLGLEGFFLSTRDTQQKQTNWVLFVTILCHLKAEMVGEGWQSISPEALSPY